MQAHHKNIAALLVLMLLVSACASVPDGPSVLALPGSGKSFDQFRLDDMDCRNYALVQIGGKKASDAANESMTKSAVLGTMIGAAAGAIGGGKNAGSGAAVGMVFGSAVGSDEARASAYGAQTRYDNAYIQCMYAKGHRVPVSGRFTTEQRPARYPPPGPDRDIPPDLKK